MVPNVLRGADDFVAGANDIFMFSFGGPKVREADATVGGVRALAIIDTPQGLEASRKVFPYGYFVEVRPGPVFVGVAQPMKVYAWTTCCSPTPRPKTTSSTRSRHDGEEQARPGRDRSRC